MQAHGLLESQTIAQAKLWKVNAAAKRKILIVDDDENIRNLVKLSLIPGQYEIMEAKDGIDALERVKMFDPDLIVLDLMMPRMDGIEMCNILKSNTKTMNIPVIMLTAKIQNLDKVEGLKSGADDYVTKPFDPLELEARVSTVLRRREESLHLNPVTGLPGYDELVKELENTKANILFADINNFSGFNTRFGYKQGNDVLKLFSRVIKHAITDLGTPADFISHLKSDNFVILTYANVDNIIDAVRDRMSRALEAAMNESIELSFKKVDSIDVEKELKAQNVMAVEQLAR